MNKLYALGIHSKSSWKMYSWNQDISVQFLNQDDSHSKSLEVWKVKLFYLIKELKYLLWGGWNFLSTYISILALQSPHQLNQKRTSEVWIFFSSLMVKWDIAADWCLKWLSCPWLLLCKISITEYSKQAVWPLSLYSNKTC